MVKLRILHGEISLAYLGGFSVNTEGSFYQ